MLTIRHYLTVAVDPLEQAARVEVRGVTGPGPLAVDVGPEADGDGWRVAGPTEHEASRLPTFGSALDAAVERATYRLRGSLGREAARVRASVAAPAVVGPFDVC